MKLAVIPVRESDMEILVNGVGNNSSYGQYIPVEQCKLTKEQVEVMARVYEEFRSDIWRDKEDCMAWALDSVGIEVEQ